MENKIYQELNKKYCERWAVREDGNYWWQKILKEAISKARVERDKEIIEIIEETPVAFRNKDGSQSPFSEKDSGILLTGFKLEVLKRIKQIEDKI